MCVVDSSRTKVNVRNILKMWENIKSEQKKLKDYHLHDVTS